MSGGPVTQRIRARATQVVAENFFLKALSLMLAVSLWAWLQTEQVVDQPSRAQVTYTLPEGLTPVEPLARTLVITVRGPQGRVRAVEGGDLSMQVDLTEVEAGSMSIDFSEHPVKGLPTGLEVVQISPPGIELQLDKEMSRIVRVRAAVIGDPADGWSRGGVIVTPPTVEIRGPQSLVKNIAEVSTDIVDISGARKPLDRKVALAVDRRTVKPVEQGKVEVSIAIDPIVQTRTFQDVPVQLRAAGWHADVASARVVLQGPVQALAKLGTDAISVQVRLPDAVEPDKASVEVEWEPDSPESRVQVVFPGPQELISVQSIRPTLFKLKPDDRPDD